jgi:hypothetical protein
MAVRRKISQPIHLLIAGREARPGAGATGQSKTRVNVPFIRISKVAFS